MRLTAKSTTATVIVGGLLALGSSEPPHAPLHADTHRPFIGLSPNLGIDGATSMRPETVTEVSRTLASGAPGGRPTVQVEPTPFFGRLAAA